MKSVLFYSMPFLFSFLAVACGQQAVKEQGIATEDTIPVRTIPLQQVGAGSVIQATGLFTTDDETILSFKNGGIINKIFVKEGDAVVKGQLLATLVLTEVEATVEQYALAYEKAERDYLRAMELYKDSVATLEQMQNAKTAKDVAQRQQDVARFNKQFSEIRATSSGYVLRRFTNDGQITGPGTPVLLINGAKQGNWLLRVGVSDQQWSMIKVGDKANIVTDVAPGKAFKAVVFKRSEGIDPASGTFSVLLKPDTPELPALATGMFAKATITPGREINGWSIPYDALLDGDAGKGFVFVTDDGKTAKKVPVSIGEVQRDHVRITGGLENVKLLIISGSAYLRDGSLISVRQ